MMQLAAFYKEIRVTFNNFSITLGSGRGGEWVINKEWEH